MVSKMRRKDPPADLRFGAGIPQNYTNVISGRGRASFRSMARPRTLPRVRPGDLLPREGRVVPGGEADLRRLSGPDRMPQLRPAPRRALRGVGGHERTRASTPEADGVVMCDRRR